ncbi:MAG: hypothetical protein IPG32_16400 [Saprospirales bacterium]|nr:hypothetical protein [Saprospirales bacterium]
MGFFTGDRKGLFPDQRQRYISKINWPTGSRTCMGYTWIPTSAIGFLR